jgi:dynein heavy chain
MKVGDNQVDFDPNFRMYMTTKMANPHYLPEVFIRVTVINFTVTDKGLEEQLLAEIVKREQPDLETMKGTLVLAIAADQKRMKRIEDDILKSLAESDENILDDEDLIGYLDNSKITSEEIKKTMEKNEVAQVEIEEAR